MKKLLALLSVCCLCLCLFPAAPAIQAAGGDSPTFVISTEKGYEGDEVTVTVSAVNNPGLAVVQFNVSYDDQVLTMLSYENGTVMEGAMFLPSQNLDDNPYSCLWNILENKTADGVMISFTFQIKEGAALGESPVTLSFDPDNVINLDGENVPFTIQNGSVTVECDHVAGDWETQKPAACEEEGQEVKKCTKCQEVLETRPIPATGHKWKETGRTEADCTNAGSISYICENDPAHTKQETIDALGHDWETEWKVDVEPTCTKPGSKSRHCTRCDAKTDVKEIEPTGHTFGAWETVDSPSCTEKRKEKRNYGNT